jgi:hypothetical protein
VERGAGRGAGAWEHDARAARSGGSDALERRGWGGVHGRARAGLAWGIDSSGRGKPGGEVTGQEMDGGVLTLLGCPWWPWRRPGRHRVLTT